jgi:phosphoribosylformylglycinamidine synthase
VLGTPFISGKDSLNNEFRPAGAQEPISIPPSLLISAMGQVDDVARCVTMDLKEAGNLIYIVGQTKNEMGGSHFCLVNKLQGGEVPKVDPEVAKATFAAVHRAIDAGLVRACHDLSEGGLAVGLAEMAFAGGLGAKVDADRVPRWSDADDAAVILFSESNTRFLCEVPPDRSAEFEKVMDGGRPSQRVCAQCIGTVTNDDVLEIVSERPVIRAKLATLKQAWQKPLKW